MTGTNIGGHDRASSACIINNGSATRSLSRFCSDVSPTIGTHP